MTLDGIQIKLFCAKCSVLANLHLRDFPTKAPKNFFLFWSSFKVRDIANSQKCFQFCRKRDVSAQHNISMWYSTAILKDSFSYCRLNNFVPKTKAVSLPLEIQVAKKMRFAFKCVQISQGNKMSFSTTFWCRFLSDSRSIETLGVFG